MRGAQDITIPRKNRATCSGVINNQPTQLLFAEREAEHSHILRRRQTKQVAGPLVKRTHINTVATSAGELNKKK